MPFNSDVHIDHAAMDAQLEAGRSKFEARNQWMTDNVLRDARIEIKKANARFLKGFGDNATSEVWNKTVQLWWHRYASTVSKTYAKDPRGDTNSPRTSETITLVLGTFAAQLRSRDRNPAGEHEPVMLSTIQAGLLALLSKFTIVYPGRILSALDKRLIKDLFARLAKTGVWFKANALQNRPAQVHRLVALHEDHALLDPLARGDRRIVLDPSAARQPLFLQLKGADIMKAGAKLRPASSISIAERITKMGFVAGALQSLGGHALRRGMAEDLLQLGGEWSTGASHSTSLALGHSDASQRKDLASYYADNAVTGLLNAGASKLSDPAALHYADGPVKRTPIAAEAPTVDDDATRHWLTSRAKTDYQERNPDWSANRIATTAKTEALRIIKEAHLAGISPREQLGLTEDLQAIPKAGVNLSMPGVASAPDEANTLSDADTLDFFASNNIGSGVALADTTAKAIPENDTLCEDVLTHGLEGTDLTLVHLAAADEWDEKDAVVIGGPSHETMFMSTSELVEFFTAYNVVRKPRTQRAAIDIALYRRAGRNPPEFMLFECPKGCGFSTDDLWIMETMHVCRRPKIKYKDSGPPTAVLTASTDSTGSKLIYAASDSGSAPDAAHPSRQSFAASAPPPSFVLQRMTDGQGALSVGQPMHPSFPSVVPAKRAHDLTTADDSQMLAQGGTHTGNAQQPRKCVELPRTAKRPMPGCKVKSFVGQRELRLHLQIRTHGFSKEEATNKAAAVWKTATSPGWLALPEKTRQN
ncbi:hypothetical protein B0A48_05976 [Cryoendolithus antarcticus]|uniref:Uncharacterized protein n=1 Tax=Cryoendolithus antarcticus TaxID=1507870 RepID=A0A1V8TCJ4_9PEZI|nr:hypothetical protein B0A48_05976 [Cryoendolithus antarcticus]